MFLLVIPGMISRVLYPDTVSIYISSMIPGMISRVLYPDTVSIYIYSMVSKPSNIRWIRTGHTKKSCSVSYYRHSTIVFK